jgi:hypothetical protein
MPTPRKTTTAKKAPAKRAPRKAAEPTTPAPSSIAAKRAQMRGEDGVRVDPYAPTIWGSEDNSGALQDLVLPSGQTVLVQRPGPQGLMQAGMLDDLDMLSTILPKIMGGKGAKGKSKELDPTIIMKNPQMLAQAMKLMDRVLVHVVIKPELTPEPDDPTDKERGKIYPSSVSMQDKTFIFNWAVGGTRDLERFREQYEESVAGVESRADLERQGE